MNALFVSIKAWQECQKFIRKAKETSSVFEKLAYQRFAMRWRMEHECLQAQYFAEVQP